MTYTVYCKSCEQPYTPAKRPYVCPHCSSSSFHISEDEFKMQKALQHYRTSGDRASYEQFGAIVQATVGKITHKMLYRGYMHLYDDIVCGVHVAFFRSVERGDDFRCIFAYLNLLCSCTLRGLVAKLKKDINARAPMFEDLQVCELPEAVEPLKLPTNCATPKREFLGLLHPAVYALFEEDQ